MENNYESMDFQQLKETYKHDCEKLMGHLKELECFKDDRNLKVHYLGARRQLISMIKTQNEMINFLEQFVGETVKN